MRDDVPVLISGGSLVGLSTGLFLAAHGVRPLVVERHPGTAIHPRAALVNQRTIELYRGVGLEPAIIEASGLEFEQNGAIVSVESLGGKELEWYYRNINDGVEGLSPSDRLFITQIGLEPILRSRAGELGVELHYGVELVSFEQTGDGVEALLREREGGAEHTVRARYLIAADGSKSSIRDALGVPLGGHGSFSNSITIYFRADLRHLIGDRNLSVIYVFGPRLQGFFRFSKAGDAGFLVVNKAVDAGGGLSADLWQDTSDEKCVELVREALGDPEIEVELENVQRWNSCADWATRFRDGSVFITGDAAHNMPPTGGFGGNTGVQDGHNLAWKLAYVLAGRAGEALLDTYDAERRPVAEYTVEQAYARYVLRLAPELGKDNLIQIVPEGTVELGYRYAGTSAILPEEGGGDALVENPHEPTGRPGTRAPHVPFLRDGDLVSIHDLAGRGFVLLAGPEGDAWCAAAATVAGETGIGIDAFRIGSDLLDPDGRSAVYGTGAAGASLVRPDGFVAWRTAEAADDAGRVLGDVLTRVLSR